jgi:hypothetical protein
MLLLSALMLMLVSIALASLLLLLVMLAAFQMLSLPLLPLQRESPSELCTESMLQMLQLLQSLL